MIDIQQAGASRIWIPLSRPGFPKSRPCLAAHPCIDNLREYPPPPLVGDQNAPSEIEGRRRGLKKQLSFFIHSRVAYCVRFFNYLFKVRHREVNHMLLEKKILILDVRTINIVG